MNDELQNKFVSEVSELIENLEGQVLGLEDDKTNTEKINEIFRVLHNIKGTASMFGFTLMGEVTHDLESVYHDIRSGTRSVTTELINITLNTLDILAILLNSKEKLNEQEKVRFNEVLNLIKGLTNNQNSEEISETSETTSAKTTNNSGYYIYFKPDKDVLTRGARPYDIFNELKEAGNFLTLPPVEENTEVEYNFEEEFTDSWEIFMVSDKSLDEIQFCFMFFLEHEMEITEVSDFELVNNKEFIKLYSKFHPNDNNSELARKNFEKLGLFQIPEKREPQPPSAPLVEKDIVEVQQNVSSIRINTDKLDSLINIIGELIISNSRLSYLTRDMQDINIRKTLGNIENLSKNLRDNTLQLRLVQINVLTTKFKRMIRDLSSKLKKEVDFVTEGAETELDSNIINNLETPMIHLIRNGIDHGIESPAERQKLNKSAKGIIRLFAYYSGSSVFIQVQDDGKGINTEYIRKKAIEKGIIPSTSKLSNKEIYDLIFLPGFSTAQNLTDVSGRGVGMDVVKKKITELRGDIEVDSEPGLGTSFTIKLPLTLSIIDTLMVKIGTNINLIPINYVVSCHKKAHDELFSGNHRRIEYKNDLIPFVYLREEFEIESNPPSVHNIVILKVNEKFYAIIVDSVMGEHQAVLKPIDLLNNDRDFFIGASVLGNGHLALILDTNQLLNKMKETELFAN